jgi:hypothetical protein
VPVFGFGISPRGPSTLPSLPTARIMSGRRDDGVEVHEAALDLVDHLFAADVIGAGLGRLALLVAAGDGEHLLALAQPVREHDGAADHLVGVLRIDAKAQRQLDGLVELRRTSPSASRGRLLRSCAVARALLRARPRISFHHRHVLPLWCKRPALRPPTFRHICQ